MSYWLMPKVLSILAFSFLQWPTKTASRKDFSPIITGVQRNSADCLNWPVFFIYSFKLGESQESHPCTSCLPYKGITPCRKYGNPHVPHHMPVTMHQHFVSARYRGGGNCRSHIYGFIYPWIWSTAPLPCMHASARGSSARLRMM